MANGQPTQLTLGSLDIHGGPPGNYTLSVLGDDATWGNPQPVETAVQTLLQQGSKVVTDHYDNREIFIRVAVTADDGQTLAEGEAALFAELGKPNSLTWTPPQMFAPPTVFRVVTSSMEFDLDDRGELYGRRVYGVRLVCEPFGRSVAEVVVDAEVQETSGGIPVTPIDLLVDDCSSATAWSAVYPGLAVVVVNSTAVAPTTGGDHSVSYLKRTGTVDMSSTPLLAVYLRGTVAGGAVALTVNGGIAAQLVGGGNVASTSASWYYFKVPVDTITSMQATLTWPSGTRGRIFIYEVRQQNNPPASGTLRQKFFTVDVPGSAPSQGTLEVSHPTDGLGMVLVHTTPADSQGFVPALRPLLTSSGPTTADASLVSGGSNVISSAPNVYQIPAAQVADGTYSIGAWLRCNATGSRTITASFTLRDAGGSLIGGLVDVATPITFSVANVWTYFPLGRVQLPTLRVSDTTTALVQASISASLGTVDLDEAYLFEVGSGSLSRLDAGTKTRVWINAPTVETPMPTILVGTQEDGSDAVASSAVSAWGTHETQPPSIEVFVVTRTALDANVRARLHPAHHTHAPS